MSNYLDTVASIYKLDIKHKIEQITVLLGRSRTSGVARGGSGGGFKPLPLKIDVYFCGLIIDEKQRLSLHLFKKIDVA